MVWTSLAFSAPPNPLHIPIASGTCSRAGLGVQCCPVGCRVLGQGRWDELQGCEAKEAETLADRSDRSASGAGVGVEEEVAWLSRFGPQPWNGDSRVSGQCWGRSSPTCSSWPSHFNSSLAASPPSRNRRP